MKTPDDNELAQRGQLPDYRTDAVLVVLPDEDPTPAGPVSGVHGAPGATEFPTVTMAEARQRTRALILRRQAGEETPIVTPWPSLTAALGGGFWPGFFTLTSGTGTGKTQFALACALVAAAAGVPVHYVALELSVEEVFARLLALALRLQRHTRVPWSELFRGQSEHVASYLEDPGEWLDGLPITIEAARPGAWPAARLQAIALGTDTETPPRLIIVDFLQLVAVERGEDPSAAMSRVGYAAREVARSKHCTVLALSSTARSNYAITSGTEEGGQEPGRGDPGRLVGLGKFTGDLEFAADGVLVTVGEGEFVQGLGRRIHLAVAKNRGGRAEWCEPMRFDGCAFEPETAPTSETTAASSGSRGPGNSKAAKATTTSAKPYDPVAPSSRDE